jgi:hypothetical protein
MNQSETRGALFVALHELSETISEMRAGQLMAAVGELCADLHGRGLWDAADSELLEAVWRFRRDFEAATAKVGHHETEPDAPPDRGGIPSSPPSTASQPPRQVS